MFLTPFNPLVAVDPTIGVNMMGGLDASGINDAETGGSSRPSACGPSDGAYPSVPQSNYEKLHIIAFMTSISLCKVDDKAILIFNKLSILLLVSTLHNNIND